MKYTFLALPVAAFALTAALLLSPTDASAIVNKGLVTCYVNHIDPDTADVSLRRFVNSAQISQQTLHLQNQGYGLEKELELARNYCIDQANQLCYNNGITPPVILFGIEAKGSLFDAPYRSRC